MTITDNDILNRIGDCSKLLEDHQIDQLRIELQDLFEAFLTYNQPSMEELGEVETYEDIPYDERVLDHYEDEAELEQLRNTGSF